MGAFQIRFMPFSSRSTKRQSFPLGIPKKYAEMKRGLKWSDGDNDDSSSSDYSSTLDTDSEDNKGSSKSDKLQSSKLKVSQAKKKKKGLDFEALSRHGYKGGLSVMNVPAPNEVEEQDWSWSKGNEKQPKEGEKSFKERQKTRAAIADGEELVYALTQKEKRNISFQQNLGQASRGKNYVEEEKRLLRDSSIYSGFDA